MIQEGFLESVSELNSDVQVSKKRRTFQVEGIVQTHSEEISKNK